MIVDPVFTAARTATTHLEDLEHYLETTTDTLPDNISPLVDGYSDFADTTVAARGVLLQVRPTDGLLQHALTDAIDSAALGAGRIAGATLLAASGHSDDVRQRAHTIVTNSSSFAADTAHRADEALALAARQIDAPQRPVSETWSGSQAALGAASDALAAVAHATHSLRTLDDVQALAQSLGDATTTLLNGMQYAALQLNARAAAELTRSVVSANYNLGFIVAHLDVATDAPDAVVRESVGDIRSLSSFIEQGALRAAAQAAAAVDALMHSSRLSR